MTKPPAGGDQSRRFVFKDLKNLIRVTRVGLEPTTK